MSNTSEIDLRQLRTLAVLFEEGSLTRAAQILNVTQPAVSKTLSHLRGHFGDPLFTRVGQRMEPTAKALEIEPEVRSILHRLASLKASQIPFDAATSTRLFKFCVVDAGLIRILPALIATLAQEAPGVRLRIVPIEEQRIESALESGSLDFAMGSYPSLSSKIRSQALWQVQYASAVRRGHPRIHNTVSAAEFGNEKHILVSTAGTGHAHRRAERAITRAVPPGNIVCTVPSFVTAACIASATDAIVTLPASMLEALAEKLRLLLFEPPIELPRIEISQHWHERFHREPGNCWIRETFAAVFSR